MSLAGTIKEFLRANRIYRKCVPGTNPFAEAGGFPRGSNSYRCTFKLGKRQMTVPFTMGPALRHPPTTQQVLDALASDAAGFENSRSFEDWKSEYGDPEENSARARRLFRAVEQQTKKLRNFLGDEAYEELLWKTSR